MKTVKKILFGFMLVVFGLTNLSMVNAAGNVYTEILWETIKDHSLRSALVGSEVRDDNLTGGDFFTQQVVNLIGYAIDVFIMIWIAIAFFWGYKIMFSDKEDAYKEWINLIAYGVIWIIIMVSAKFISGALVGDWGILSEQRSEVNATGPNWIEIAQQLYERVMYPFIKVALYLIVWILFFIMAAKVVTFIISTDDVAKKKAWWIILWTTIWMFIILWAKQVVEAVMWNESTILNDQAKYVDEIWELPTTFGHIPLVHNILNWVMWLTMFVVLVLVIIQAYTIFAKPDDPKNRERLKKTLLYILIWVLVVGASYVISSFLVINDIPETVATANP